MPKNLVHPRNAEIANKMPTTKATLTQRDQKKKSPGKIVSPHGSSNKEDTIDIVVTRNRKT